jgi:hypothetical protein
VSTEPDVLARLVAYHDHIDVPHVDVDDDVRRGRRRVRRNRSLLTAGLAGAATVVLVTVSLLGTGAVTDRPQPVAPRPTQPAPSPTAGADWTGPLRHGATMPSVAMELDDRGRLVWTDGNDASAGGIDILAVGSEHSFGDGDRWTLDLREAPPRASTLDPSSQVIEYGVVLDADADGVADCQIGINNDAPNPGDFRVWVTNLRTGRTQTKVGPNYGYPVEFVHPDEQRADSMSFLFLGHVAEPCSALGTGVRFYAWSSFTEGGRVIAWDYAPDVGWIAP